MRYCPINWICSALECAGRAKRRRRFGFVGGSNQSGFVLRVPPHSRFAGGDLRLMERDELQRLKPNRGYEPTWSDEIAPRCKLGAGSLRARKSIPLYFLSASETSALQRLAVHEGVLRILNLHKFFPPMLAGE